MSTPSPYENPLDSWSYGFNTYSIVLWNAWRQKSLKFTTLLHGLVTRYGPQLKPFLSELRAAIGRCSTFMVKTVLAALQRLEK